MEVKITVRHGLRVSVRIGTRAFVLETRVKRYPTAEQRRWNEAAYINRLEQKHAA